MEVMGTGLIGLGILGFIGAISDNAGGEHLILPLVSCVLGFFIFYI